MSAEQMIRRLKPIDYSAIEGSLKEKKLRAAESSMRVKEIKSVSVQIKDKKLLQQHVHIWSKEFLRLNWLNKKVQATLDKFHIDSTAEGDLKTLFVEINKLEDQLATESSEFRKNVIDPPMALREDLKFYIHSKKNGEAVSSPLTVKDIVDKMKIGLEKSQRQLELEEAALLDAMEEDWALRELVPQDVDDVMTVVPKGIPDDAWELESPSEDFKAELLGEFILLDDFYHQQWQYFRVKFRHILEKVYPAPWRAEEVDFAGMLLDGYRNFCTVNRHTLILDLLRQLFPTRKRPELLALDSWLEDKRIFGMQSRAFVHDWQRSRQELFNRIRVTLDDAVEASSKQQQQQETMEAQRQLCSELSHQVTRFREQKIEMLELQQKMMSEEMERMKQLEAKKMEAEKNEREKKKASIKQFKDQREAVSAAAIASEEARLQQLHELLNQQAQLDKERVKYREDLFVQKQREFQDKMLLKQEVILEKEKRLEDLRKKVRPEVEMDPLRLLQPTKAWEIHTKKDVNDDEDEWMFGNAWAVKYDLAHFPSANGLRTFNEKQLQSDQRLRAEIALRDAGLMHSEYARQVLQRLPGAQPVRKDNQLSTNTDFLKYL